MAQPFTFVFDLAAEVEPPNDGILTRTLFSDADVKVVLFGFSVGQELSEHTSPMPAILQFLTGEAVVTLGDDKLVARAGTWIHLPANLPHRILTKSAVKMLLTLLKTT